MTNIKNGFWNGGAEPITYQIVDYIVLEPEIPTWWTARFIGQIRQGILIRHRDHKFLIDNQHADGYCKIAAGGNPWHSHKSVSNYEIVNYDVPTVNINFRLDIEGLKRDHDEHREWLRLNHPESYEKTKAIEEALKAHKVKYKI